MMNDDDMLLSHEYEAISYPVKWYIYEILVLFPKLEQKEWSELLLNLVHNNLPADQALILQDPSNARACLSVKGLMALWNDPSQLKADFPCSVEKMHAAITKCIETITNGEDEDIKLDEIRNPKLSKKQQDEADFNAFKIAYYKDYRSKWWSNPSSTMKKLLEKDTITNMDQVRAYASEPKNESTRTAILVNQFFPSNNSAATSNTSQDETDFKSFKTQYYKDYRSKWWSAPWSTMKKLLEKNTITTMAEVRAYAHEHPTTRTARIIKNLFPNNNAAATPGDGHSYADLSGPKI